VAFPLGVVALACLLIAGWLSGLLASSRRLFRDRLMRTAMIGPALGIALFVTLAPYGEMRFAYPSLVLMFVATCIGLARLPRGGHTALAAMILLVSAATAFKFNWARDFMIAGAFASVLAAGIVAATQRSRVATKAFAALAIAACVGGMMLVYVNWTAYVRQCQVDSTVAWGVPPPDQYGELGQVWKYVRDELPKGSTIAYANTYFTYPLMGFAYDHRVVYAPTRAGLERFVDVPAIEGKVSGEQIVSRVVEMLRENPDREQWLRRLRVSGADYLVVGKMLAETKSAGAPPEIGFASALPQTFAKVFENDAGIVFRISW